MRPLTRALVAAGAALTVLGAVLTTVSVAGRHEAKVLAAGSSRPVTTRPLPAAAPPSSGAAAQPAVSGATSSSTPATGTGIVVVASSGPAQSSPADEPSAATGEGQPAAPAAVPLTASETVALSCPLPVPPATASTAGIAKLIDLVPLFGPFSAEAFAGLPLFQPLLVLVSPLLPSAQQTLVSLQPLINAAVPLVQTLENAGFQTLAPAYAPFRVSLLALEKQLSDGLAPLVAKVASLPGAGCVPALEQALVTLAAGS